MHRILAAISLCCICACAPAALNAVDVSLRPTSRGGDAATPVSGPICGSPKITGFAIAPFTGKHPGCGVADPYKVTSVAGIALSTPSIMNCTTAQALLDWTEQGVLNDVDGYRGGVAEYHVVGHYSCRTRNNRPGAKLSQHAKGRAIDIAAFKMADGSQISLIKDGGQGTPGRILQNLHTSACKVFGTVLGPDADAAHKDHFHFDTTPRRSGAYCR